MKIIILLFCLISTLEVESSVIKLKAETWFKLKDSVTSKLPKLPFDEIKLLKYENILKDPSNYIRYQGNNCDDCDGIEMLCSIYAPFNDTAPDVPILSKDVITELDFYLENFDPTSKSDQRNPLTTNSRIRETNQNYSSLFLKVSD